MAIVEESHIVDMAEHLIENMLREVFQEHHVLLLVLLGIVCDDLLRVVKMLDDFRRVNLPNLQVLIQVQTRQLF